MRPRITKEKQKLQKLLTTALYCYLHNKEKRKATKINDSQTSNFFLEIQSYLINKKNYSVTWLKKWLVILGAIGDREFNIRPFINLQFYVRCFD